MAEITEREVGMILNKLENMDEDIRDNRDNFKETVEKFHKTVRRIDQRMDTIETEQKGIKTFARGSWIALTAVAGCIPIGISVFKYFGG